MYLPKLFCRFEELQPILLQFIKSCQRDGKQIVLVAHNARRFDIPFLIREFQHCKVEVPKDWLFVDTLPLAKKLLKLDGRSMIFQFQFTVVMSFYTLVI